MDYFSCVSLQGPRISLVPISLDHISELAIAGADEAIWRWMPSAHFLPGSMTEFVKSAIVQRDAYRAIPFTTVDNATSKKIGSTRFHFIEPEHRRLEIGAALEQAANSVGILES